MGAQVEQTNYEKAHIVLCKLDYDDEKCAALKASCHTRSVKMFFINSFESGVALTSLSYNVSRAPTDFINQAESHVLRAPICQSRGVGGTNGFHLTNALSVSMDQMRAF
jgi:hypothetical protein